LVSLAAAQADFAMRRNKTVKTVLMHSKVPLQGLVSVIESTPVDFAMHRNDLNRFGKVKFLNSL